MFEEKLNQLDVGYKNGIVGIGELESINNIISSLPLQKRSGKQQPQHIAINIKDKDHIFNCSCSKLDIDTAAIYYCAFYIKAGLHPVLMYYSDHVGVGVWLDKNAGFGSSDQPMLEKLKKSVFHGGKNGKLLLLDTWSAVGSTYNFWDGSAYCMKKLDSIKMLFDFNYWNKGNLDCIILDENQYMTDEQTRSLITGTLHKLEFGDLNLSENFRNVHFFDIDSFDRKISDIIQNDYSFYVKNINAEKQISICLDAALNMNCSDKSVIILAKSRVIDRALRKLRNIGAENIVELDEELFETDERPIDILVKTMEELKSGFIEFIHKRLLKYNTQKAEISNDEDEISNDEVPENLTEDEQKQFFELSDKEKKLLEKPENSDKTLMELYEVYFNKKMYKLFDNIPKNHAVIQDIETVKEKNLRLYEVKEHICNFSQIRKNCILQLDDAGKVFDLIALIKEKQTDRLKKDFANIAENKAKLNDIYFNICKPNEKNIPKKITPQCMEKYKNIFRQFLGLSPLPHISETFESYKNYLEYKHEKSYFSGDDFEKYFIKMSETEKNQLKSDIMTLKTVSNYDVSQKYKTTELRVNSIIKSIMPENADDMEILKDKLLRTVELRIDIKDENIKIFKCMDAIFSNVNEKKFVRQYAWVKGYNKINCCSIAAEVIVNECSDNAEIYDNFKTYLEKYDIANSTLPKEITDSIENINQLLSSDLCDKYENERSWFTENGISNYFSKICKMVEYEDIDKETEFFKNAIEKIYIEQVFKAYNMNLQAIPFEQEAYQLLFNKLKKSYQYKIIHKTDNDKRIVFCPCRDAQNYHNRNFNKLIILGAEDVDYERLSTLITKSENVVLMCDKESSSKDSIISLLGENIVTFDYSSSNME